MIYITQVLYSNQSYAIPHDLVDQYNLCMDHSCSTFTFITLSRSVLFKVCQKCAKGNEMQMIKLAVLVYQYQYNTYHSDFTCMILVTFYLTFQLGFIWKSIPKKTLGKILGKNILFSSAPEGHYMFELRLWFYETGSLNINFDINTWKYDFGTKHLPVHNHGVRIVATFVFKALWYRKSKKKKKKKTRLLIWILHRMYQSIHHSNCANVMKKWMVDFLLEVRMCFIMLKYWGYSALYNSNLHRLTCKMPLFQKVK